MSAIGTCVRVRQASATDQVDVLNVLNGSALATDIDQIAAAINHGNVLVAVTADSAARPPVTTDSPDTERILGALVLDGKEITAVAVRRRRRNQGIGTSLVEAASQRCDRLVARFDAGVRPFWDSLGFEITPVADADRYRGVR